MSAVGEAPVGNIARHAFSSRLPASRGARSPSARRTAIPSMSPTSHAASAWNAVSSPVIFRMCSWTLK